MVLIDDAPTRRSLPHPLCSGHRRSYACRDFFTRRSADRQLRTPLRQNLFCGGSQTAFEPDHYRYWTRSNNDKGLVEFSADVEILHPKANSNGTALVEISNRGG